MSFTVSGRGRISREVLGLLMNTPGQELHTREIARRVEADAHPVQRGLEQLLNEGVVQSRRVGNLRLWSVAEDSPLVPALREVVRRTAGISERLRQRFARMPGVHLAFLFGSYAAGVDKLGSDIDLFVMGSPDWGELSKELTSLSSGLGREVNPVVWAVEELERPTRTQARFLSGLLREPRIWLKGDDHELERLRSSVGASVVRGSPSQARSARRRGGQLASRAGRTQRRPREA